MQPNFDELIKMADFYEKVTNTKKTEIEMQTAFLKAMADVERSRAETAKIQAETQGGG